MLKLEGWAEERPLQELLFHNHWNNIAIPPE
jgi:5,6-dimethylbenzimidazole synthase